MTTTPYDISNDAEVTVKDLPLIFKVKYLGSQKAVGLWGIKHTRRPVDALVEIAKNLPLNKFLPTCNLTVSCENVQVETVSEKKIRKLRIHGIDTISYGVQDLVYTRVFAMITVKENHNLMDNPFEVHAFVCDSRAIARQLTFALAAAFQDYSKRVKEIESQHPASSKLPPKKFAIDLRSPEEMQQDLDQETEA